MTFSRLIVALVCAGLGSQALGQGITFNDVSAQSGLAVSLHGITPGLALGDIDGDGWLDVMITGAANKRPQVFHNRGAYLASGGSGPLFANVTARIFAGGSADGSHALFTDLDNDGDPDVVLVRRYIDPQTGTTSSKHTGIEFFRNTKGGRVFELVPSNGLLGRDATPFGGLTVGDPDMDGDLDLVFVHNGGGNGVGGPGYFLRNQGNFQFADDTAVFSPELASVTRYFSAILYDFSGDGLMDLHNAVDFYTDRHFHGGVGGMLSEVTGQVGTTNQGSDMGLAMGDPDNDGDFDIYSTNINTGVFYENDGNGNFQNTASAHGIAFFNQGLSTCVGWGTAFADFDLDGDEDLITVGSLGLAELFENGGTGHFTRASSGAGIVLIGRSLVVFDHDHDGDLDVLVSYDGVNQTPRLYENITSSADGRHWLVIQPRGTVSNADGIGAHVRITIAGVAYHRAVVRGHSFKSGLANLAHFGLGNATNVDEVKIFWPSGKVSTLTNVPVDQTLEIVEPNP